jgi:hypothetical protein
VVLMIAITNYSNAPGPTTASPSLWPKQSQIQRAKRLPTLVMFAHPRCPCTRASIGELSVLMTRCDGQIDAHVVFLDPPEVDSEWVRSDLWRQASSIPGVRVHADKGGAETKLFQSQTSGHCVVYHEDGRLMFQGGITISRGHWGDSPGLAAIESLVLKKQFAQVRTPIFGCSLLSTNCENVDPTRDK